MSPARLRLCVCQRHGIEHGDGPTTSHVGCIRKVKKRKYLARLSSRELHHYSDWSHRPAQPPPILTQDCSCHIVPDLFPIPFPAMAIPPLGPLLCSFAAAAISCSCHIVPVRFPIPFPAITMPLCGASLPSSLWKFHELTNPWCLLFLLWCFDFLGSAPPFSSLDSREKWLRWSLPAALAFC